MRIALVLVLVLVNALASNLVSSHAHAAPPASTQEDQQAALVEAKELFRRGVALYEAGDVDRALEMFLRSRARFRSPQNTINAAVCLDRLGRSDEALEMYEEAMLLGDALDAGDRERVTRKAAELLPKLSSIEVSSNVAGAIVTVDGRARGKLPLASALRVVAGRRRVRVLSPGWTTFERDLDTTAGATQQLDASLAPLASSGVVRIEDPSSEGAEVFVDGASVGTTPWEGTLSVGKHTVWITKGERGSPPTAVLAVAGQLAVLRLRAERLGALLRVSVTPPDALLAIDGAEMPFASWQGHLPAGRHRLFASARGWLARESVIVVPEGDAAPVDAVMRLEREPPPPSGEIVVGAFAGYEAESFLSGDSSVAPPFAGTPMRGWIAALRLAYRFPSGLALEAGGGLYRLASDTTSDGRTPATWLVEAPFGQFGASHRVALGAHVAFVPRVTAGMLFTKRTLTDVTGHASEHTARQIPFLAPQAGAEWRFGALSIGASFGVRLVTETITWAPELGGALAF